MLVVMLNKYMYGAILLIVLGTVGYFAVSNFRLNSQIRRQTEEIAKLNTQLVELNKEKAALKEEVQSALSDFMAQKKKTEAAELKLANLKPVIIPTTTTDTISVECLEQLHLVQQQYEIREVVFTEVITEQKHTIASAEAVISTLKQEIAVSDSIIATHEKKDAATLAKTVALEDKLQKQESAKKMYRTSTAVLGTVLLILLL